VVFNITGVGNLDIANHQFGFPDGLTLGDVGVPTLTTFGGVINDLTTGYLEIGVTDAAQINGSTGGGLEMEAPAANTISFTASGGTSFNQLQTS
jgi:hypothetical protein